MADTLSPEEKAVFKRAAQRRNENGVKRKMIRMYAEESQAVAFSELWESYVLRWGKTGALDHLIRLMALVEARLRDKERADNSKRS